MKRGRTWTATARSTTQIVAHEWGHYISNRLVGNANGLINNQGRSMGEGWADFHAMLMTVRDEDRNVPGNSQFQGVYAMAGLHHERWRQQRQLLRHPPRPVLDGH